MEHKQKLTFYKWMAHVRRSAKALVWPVDNEEDWVSYYESGYRPKEAVIEDMKNCD